MKISIITICKNNLNGIKSTLKSVDEQTSSYFEHIMIDGASTDGSFAYILENEKPYRVALSEPDTGISNAFNKGLALASGDYVVFLNSGDTFTSNNVIESVVDDIHTYGEIDIYTYVGKLGGHTVPEKIEEKYADEYWCTAKLPHQATFVRKALFDTLGGFDENLKLRMDYDFFYRCYKSGSSYKYIPRLIVEYEDGGACLSDLDQFVIEGCQVQKRYEGRLCKQSVDEMISIYLTKNDDLKIWKMYRIMERIAMVHGGGSLAERLANQGYQVIAIYGNGIFGQALEKILTSAGIRVSYFIDRFSTASDVYSFADEWPEVDAILISTMDAVDRIKEDICEKVNIPTLSAEELVDDRVKGRK